MLLKIHFLFLLNISRVKFTLEEGILIFNFNLSTLQAWRASVQCVTRKYPRIAFITGAFPATPAGEIEHFNNHGSSG